MDKFYGKDHLLKIIKVMQDRGDTANTIKYFNMFLKVSAEEYWARYDKRLDEIEAMDVDPSSFYGIMEQLEMAKEIENVQQSK